MDENNIDPPEFTDEQLRAALRRMGREARQEAFRANLPVIVLKGRSLVALHPDGTEEILEPLSNGSEAGPGQE